MTIEIKPFRVENNLILSYSINGVFVDNRKDNDLKKSIKRTINLLKARNKYIKETTTEDNIKTLTTALNIKPMGALK
jgi:hypothetical protein